MEGLGASEDCRQRLDRATDQVIVRLLGGQADPGCLGVEAQHQGARVFSAKAVPHDSGPHSPGGPEFSHFFKQIVLGDEKEGHSGRKAVHIQPSCYGRLQVGNCVGKSERQLLDGRCASFPHVVAADADGVPAGHFFGAILEDIHHQAHGRSGRVGVGPPGDVFLKNVVLQGAVYFIRRDALAFGCRNVKAQKDRSR